jgi:hypothetical protein
MSILQHATCSGMQATHHPSPSPTPSPILPWCRALRVTTGCLSSAHHQVGSSVVRAAIRDGIHGL